MESIRALRKLLTNVGPAVFSARFPYGFLLRRPTSGQANTALPIDDDGTEAEDESSSVASTTRLAVPAMAALHGLQDELRNAVGWMLVGLPRLEPEVVGKGITLGRARECEVVLSHPTVSKRHVRFDLNETGVCALTDLGSSNGTFINGVRANPNETVPFQLGDRVRLGALELEFVPASTVYSLLVGS
jgi:hypothetical protein